MDAPGDGPHLTRGGAPDGQGREGAPADGDPEGQRVAAGDVENAAAVSPRAQLDSSRIGGKSSEKAVRALTLTPMVTKATTTMTQP